MSTISKQDFIAVVKQCNVPSARRMNDWLNDHDAKSAKELARLMVHDQLLTPWQAKYLISGRSRLTIGNYVRLDLVQKDQMGDRFLAIHHTLNRKVILQVLTRDLTRNTSQCEEFIQKATQVAKLDHPNLVHVYDIDQEGGRYYLVIEHVEGKTLDEFEGRQFSAVEIARIIMQAAAGMSYAHENSVIHGCLTQADLILTPNGEIKIQRLPLSPLQHKLSQANSPPTSATDFNAISKIGFKLLQRVSEDQPSRDRDEVKSILFNLRTNAPDTGEVTVGKLKEWLESKTQLIDDSPQPADVTAPATPTDKGFSNKTNSTFSPQTAAPTAVSTGFLHQLWQNPMTQIGAAAVLAVLLLVGSAMGIAKFFRNSDSNVVNHAPDQSSSAEAITNTDSNLPAQQKTNPVRSEVQPGNNPPSQPITEESDSFVSDTGEKNLAESTENQNSAPITETAKTPTIEAMANQATDANEVENRKVENPTTETNQPQSAGNIASNQQPDDGVAPDVSAPTQDPLTASPTVPEALTEISGIGAVTQRQFYQSGVTTFKQITELSAPQIKTLLKKAGSVRSLDLVECQSWIDQAKEKLGDSTGESDTASTPQPDSIDPWDHSFANFPSLIELPDTTDTTEIKISDLKIRPIHLLDATLVSDPGVAKIRMMFELNRLDDDKQKWIVGVKRRPKDTATPIAMFRKSEDAFYFQWLPDAEQNNSAKFLQNCFVKLSLPDEQSTLVTLRKPVKLPPLRLTEAELNQQIEIEIPALPNLENLVIEVLPMRIPGVPTAIAKSGIEKGSPGRILLKRDDKTGFLWIEVAGDVGSKLKLQSSLMILAYGQSKRVRNLKSLSEVAQKIRNDERIAFNRLQQASNQHANAPYGKKTEYAAIKKDREKDMKAIQVMSQKILQYSEILPSILNQPISVRVYSRMGQYQIVLAVTEIPQAAEPDAAEQDRLGNKPPAPKPLGQK